MPLNSDPELYEDNIGRPPSISYVECTPKKLHQIDSRVYYSDGNSSSNTTPLKKHTSYIHHPKNHLMTPISPVETIHENSCESILSDTESELLFSTRMEPSLSLNAREKSGLLFDTSPNTHVNLPIIPAGSEVFSGSAYAITQTLSSVDSPEDVLRDITSSYLQNRHSEYVFIEEGSTLSSEWWRNLSPDPETGLHLPRVSKRTPSHLSRGGLR